MAAPMWRMNGVRRRVAGVLVLCALLLSNAVMCQDDADATDTPAAGAVPPDPADPTNAAGAADPADTSAVTDADSAVAPDTTAVQDEGANPTVAAGEEAATSAAGDSSLPLTIVNVDINPDNQDGGPSGPSGTTPGPIVREEVVAPADVPDDSHNLKLVVPEVMCVGEGDISESSAVVFEVETTDCEETRHIIRENSAGWCKTPQCSLKLFQKGKKLLLTSDDVKPSDLSEVLRGALKDKLTKSPSSSSSSVFVGILVSGLLAAVGITVGYFKCQRRSSTKGVRLGEEAYPVGDQENQGNTLVSVAPLNPPPETQEKPSVNGESPEAAKTQPPPPTNGHSTTKTADTEM